MTFRVRPIAALTIGSLLVAGCGGGEEPPHAVDQPPPTSSQLRRPGQVGSADRSPEEASTSEQPPDLVGQTGTAERGQWIGARRRTTFGEWTMQQTAIDALTRIGKPAVSELIHLLGDPNPQLRAEAALALARIGPDASEAVQPLMMLVQNDPDAGVRKNAVRALGQIGPAAQKAVSVLVEQLRVGVDEPTDSESPTPDSPDREDSTGSGQPIDGR